MRILHFLFFILVSTPLLAQKLVVTEVHNAAISSQEWIELLTLEDSDLRGWKINDYRSSGSIQRSISFTQNEVWANIPAGTLILLYNSDAGFEDDLNSADFNLRLSTENPSFIDGGAFSITDSDAIQILDADDQHVHALAFGPGNENSISESPRNWGNISLGVGESAVLSSSSPIIDIVEDGQVEIAAEPSPGVANSPSVEDFIQSLWNLSPLPDLSVFFDSSNLENGDTAFLGYTEINTSSNHSISLSSGGLDSLIITSVEVNGETDLFQIQNISDTLGFGQETQLEITFSPVETGDFSVEVLISSNDADYPQFLILIAAVAYDQNSLIPPQDNSIDIVTWNVEWFGSTSNGPSNESLQYDNVKRIIEDLDADLYALQEISSESRFFDLVSDMDGYAGIFAGYSQPQNTAYIYRVNTIRKVSDQLINVSSSPFAGRRPFRLNFESYISNNVETPQPLTAINIHAKAFADEASYNQRVEASQLAKTYMDSNLDDDFLIFLGDYNDDVDESILDGEPSPYQNFVEDTNYVVVTKSLSDAGRQSTVGFGDMIDHITVSNELKDYLIENSEMVYTQTGVVDFGNTTSDHYPVLLSIFKTANTSATPEYQPQLPERISISNYPNPFNPSTNIEFTLNSPSRVTVDVFNITGKKVRTLIRDSYYGQGSHQITFEAGNLPSGLYLIGLNTKNNPQVFHRVTLIR